MNSPGQESSGARFTQAMVGLSKKRPFQFCTIEYGGKTHQDVSALDDLSLFRYKSYPPGVAPSTIPEHSHDFYEIALMHDGHARHHVPGREPTVLGRGDVVLTTPHGVHGYREVEAMLKTNLYLRPEWLVGDLKLLWHEEGLVRHLLADALFHLNLNEGVFLFHTEEEETRLWEQEIAALGQEARLTQPSLALFNGSFLKILAILNDAFLRDFPAIPLPLRPEVWAAAQYIERSVNLCQRCEIGQLARSVGMSPAHFTRSFRESTGLAPMEYYQKRRIQYAARLLTEPGATVTDVALQFGFSDSSHFSRVFKKLMGMPPNQFRQRHEQARERGVAASDIHQGS